MANVARIAMEIICPPDSIVDISIRCTHSHSGESTKLRSMMQFAIFRNDYYYMEFFRWWRSGVPSTVLFNFMHLLFDDEWF